MTISATSDPPPNGLGDPLRVRIGAGDYQLPVDGAARGDDDDSLHVTA
jgi:hypothetical protein